MFAESSLMNLICRLQRLNALEYQVTCTSHSATKYVDSAQDQNHLGLAKILVRLNNFGNLADDRTSFRNDINHSFVLSPQLRMNSGYTPSSPAAIPSLTDFGADSSSLMLKFAEKAGWVVSVLFNSRCDDFDARAWFFSIGTLETHISREAMLVAVTILGGAICAYFFQ
jgi:hypothetical protein